MLYYVKHDELDITKWNATINTAINSNIFAYYWFLNLTTNNNWDALIENDYETVMPLPFKNNLGIKKLYIPQNIPLLGIYGKKFLTKARIKLFLETAKKHFFSINYTLSKYNETNAVNNLKINTLTYFAKDLIYSYEKQIKTYTLNAQQIIAKSQREGYYINNNININGIIQFLIEQNYFSDLSKIEIIKNILLITKEKNKLTYDALYNKDSKLHGIAIYFINKNNVTLWKIITIYHKCLEKQKLINFSLINNFIRNFSGKNIVINFFPNSIKNNYFELTSLGFKSYYYLNINYNKIKAIFS